MLKKHLNSTRPLIIAACFLQAASVFAQGYEPASIKVGEALLFVPTATMALGYDDNLTHSPEATSSSSFSILATEGLLSRRQAKTDLQLGYELEKGSYLSSAQDDYLDYQVDITAEHEFSSRHKMAFLASHQRGHEARGTGFTEGEGDKYATPVKSQVSQFGADYWLGVESARFQSRLSIQVSDLSFQNLKELTALREYKSLQPSAEVFYRLFPKTRLVVELSRNEVSYETQSVLDNHTDRLLAGLSWQVTGKTTGHAKLGYEKKSFDDAAMSGTSGLAWDLGLDWYLKSYSVFQFETGKSINEPDSNVGANYIEATETSVSWNHEWRRRFSTSSQISYLEESDHEGTEEQFTRFSLTADYEFRRWLKFSANYAHSQQKSPSAPIEYDKNLFSISLSAGF